jgi:hypothetical protein
MGYTLRLLLAVSLACSAVLAFAKKEQSCESGKVISQNVNSTPGGVYAAPVGTAAVAVPIYRQSNIVVIETKTYRYQLSEVVRRGAIILPVNAEAAFCRDGKWFVFKDVNGKEHKFNLVGMTALGNP